MNKRERIRQLAEQHEKSRFDFVRSISRFLIASCIVYVLAGMTFCVEMIKQKYDYDIIQQIDERRRIVRTINSYNFLKSKAEYDFYSAQYVKASEVEKDLRSIVARKGKQHLWSDKMYYNAARILAYFNNDDTYQVDWKILLAIFAHESQMNPWAVSGTNFDGTRDYGIGQHNSCCIDIRYRNAVMVNQRLKIIDGRLVNADRLNLFAGMIATAVHMKENRDVILRHNARNPQAALGPDHWIIGYNAGINGVMGGSYRKKYLDLIEINYNGITEL